MHSISTYASSVRPFVPNALQAIDPLEKKLPAKRLERYVNPIKRAEVQETVRQLRTAISVKCDINRN